MAQIATAIAKIPPTNAMASGQFKCPLHCVIAKYISVLLTLVIEGLKLAAIVGVTCNDASLAEGPRVEREPS